MAYNVATDFQTESVKLSDTHLVTMAVVNASLSGFDPYYFVDLNQNIMGWNMVNATGDLENVATEYTAIPMEYDAVTSNVQGEIDGISITIPNVDRSMETVVQDNNYLRGCDIHIVCCFAKNLPSGVSASYIGESANYRAVIKEKFYVDSTTTTENVITFTCKSKFNIKNVKIPRRTYGRDCQWETFGSPPCNADSAQVASWVTCDRTIHDCRLRQNTKRFGGFPSVPRRGIYIT